MTDPVIDAAINRTLERLREASHAVLFDAPLLERWSLDRSTGDRCLIGFVSGHPHLGDGRYVRTSVVLRHVPEAGWALTLNRVYRLGISMDDWRRLA